MKRVKLCSSVAFGVAVAFATLSAASASVYDDARRICNERYEAEKTGGSVPAGMSKSKYLSQCQGGYVRSIKLEDELEQARINALTGNGVDKQNGQGGPELLLPGAAEKPTKKAPTKATVPAPRFKPTI